MSIAVTFRVEDDDGDSKTLFTVPLLAVPREGEIVEFGGFNYEAGPPRWLFSDARGKPEFSGVEITLELRSDAD
jgi:hypothetical protein